MLIKFIITIVFNFIKYIMSFKLCIIDSESNLHITITSLL